MGNETFSILTASYNGAIYLTDWAKSVIAQEHRPLEVVFVNDCSTDDTELRFTEVMKSFKKHNVSLKIIRNSKRMYYGDSLRLAFENASGNYFGILDVDDALVPNSVEYVMDLYRKHPKVGFIYTQFDKYDKTLRQRRGNGFSRAPSPGFSLLDMGIRNIHTFSHWRTFSRRVSDLSQIWKEGLRCSVDKYMGYRLEELSVGGFAPRVCYRYRWGTPGSISSTERSKQMWRQVMKEAMKRRKAEKIKAKGIVTLR